MKELIERLNRRYVMSMFATPAMLYDTLNEERKKAADALEQQAAELVSLRLERDMRRMAERSNAELRKQIEELAAALATIAEMREALQEAVDGMGGSYALWAPKAQKTLTLHANQDALHEALARECERLAELSVKNSNALGNRLMAHWLCEEAAAHRARKEKAE